MTEKRFKLHIIWLNNDYEEGEAELKDRGQPLALFDSVEDARIVKDLLNELNDTNNELQKENKQLKQELQKIYEIATVNKVRDIVEECELLNKYDIENRELKQKNLRLIDSNHQLKLILNDDSIYQKMIHYRKRFIEVCDELADEGQINGKLEKENQQLKSENKELKEEIIEWKSKYFDAMDTVINEYSTNIKEDMEELEKEVWGDIE